MKKLGLFAAAAVLACAAAPASAAPIIIDFTGNSGAFSQTGIGAGAFDDTGTFTVGTGMLGADIVTIALSELTDVDFTSVTLNGVEFTIDDTDGSGFGRENRFLEGINVTSGTQTLRVQGVSGGEGAYAGTISFVARQVPEPAGWTTMVLALGLLGGGLKMSRRNKRVPATA